MTAGCGRGNLTGRRGGNDHWAGRGEFDWQKRWGMMMTARWGGVNLTDD